jgi:hypothetical protein
MWIYYWQPKVRIMRHRNGRSASAGRRALLIASALLALFAMIGTSAASAAPKGEYINFADCPTKNPELSGCIYGKTSSGEFTIGKQQVPIVKPQVIQGGFIENEETGALQFVAAADGNTLPKTPQKVPGGLAGLVRCNEISNIIERIACEVVFENGATGVNATIELAGPASSIVLNEINLFGETGTAIGLPVKVHLENPFLGSECYIGSNSSPVHVELTTGTTAPPLPNKPIKGKLGTISTRDGGRILVIGNNTLVDNSFAAPGVSGCGGIFSFLLNPIINSKIGLPASAGHNTAILNGTLEQTSAEAAREHE